MPEMTKSALRAVSKTILTVCLADTPLITLLGGNKVFDEVPEGTTHPYITIFGCTSTPFNTHTTAGEAVVATLHVLSDYNGSKEVDDILERLNDLFGGKVLESTVTGISFIHSFFVMSTRLKLKDRLRQGVAQYRFLTQEA